jgi:hypothetical protein
MSIYRDDEKTYQDGDIMYSDYAGIADVVMEHPGTRLQTTANEVLRIICLNGGYSEGNEWETERHRYFIKQLLDKAYTAVLSGDINLADLYLSLGYWNSFYIDKMVKNADWFRFRKQESSANAIMSMTQYANTNFRCKALYAVIWHKHIGLLNYVLSKINACNISEEDFHAACVQGLGKYICKKDPSKYYMDKNLMPKMRTLEEQHEYVMQQKSNYKTLAIHRFSKKTKDNIVLTGIPTEVMRTIITMV